MEALNSSSWLEVQFQFPDGCDLEGESGGFSDAYMRVDSKTAVKFEIKWEKIKKGQKVQPLTVVNNFLENYMKKSKKKIKKVDVRDRGTIMICDHKAYYARWMADIEMVTVSWICTEENKYFLLNYYLEPEEKWEDATAWLVPGIVCHTPEKFWKYRILGVEFNVPKGYWLSRRVLIVGKSTLIFKSKDRGIMLIHWASFAKENLAKHKDLVKWFKSDGPKEMRDLMRSVPYKNIQLDDTGTKATMESRKSAGLIQRRNTVETIRIWNDVEHNKLFVVSYVGPETNINDLVELKDSIKVQIG